jgi:L-ribulose-5-phosphate 4-epimerase
MLGSGRRAGLKACTTPHSRDPQDQMGPMSTIDDLKRRVLEANQRVVREGLVTGTFGNVSGVDRELGLVVIKGSGVSYDAMTHDHMVAVSLDTGHVAGGTWRPSSDTPTHLAIYRAFEAIGGVVHTHSLYASAWAQACREIPVFGTTHADYVNGPVPCTRALTADEIDRDYELNTGLVIVERFAGINPIEVPAVLVASHGPFAWGVSVESAVDHAVYLEYIARLASETLRTNMASVPIGAALLQKHFRRKHGPAAYYGQG